MSSLTINKLINWSNSEPGISDSIRNKHFNTICNDSRILSKDDIFLALKSERGAPGGHDYVSSALNSGAIAAIISKEQAPRFSSQERKKCIIVDDPLSALQKMATEYRKELGIPFVGITGSNGKTTTRHFISSVLESKYNIGKTLGNWNNHIGVPLSILRMTGKEEIAVVEFGANHRNEIDPLSNIAKPDISIITNIGYAHVGNFGSLKNTTEVKFEIINGMDKKKGLLLLNGDDKRLVSYSKQLDITSKFFGFSRKCSISPKGHSLLPNRYTVFSIDGHQFTLSTFGKHFVYSALPAIYIARKFEIPDNEISEVLYSIKPDSLRGGIETKSGVTFIIDCYNANPSSMGNAVSLLKDLAIKRNKCAIVGDMLELGKYTKSLHKQLGRRLAKAGVCKLIIVGEFGDFVLDGALQGGMANKNIFVCPNAIEAGKIAKEIFTEGDFVLLKGSRAIKLETVYDNF